MATLSAINIKFFADLKQFSSEMQNAERKIKKFGRNMKKTGKNLSISVTAPIIAVGTYALKSASDLETMQTSFESMLGSAEKAKQLTEDLINFTASTPFQLDGVGKSAKQLLAFGVAQEDVLDKLKVLGDVSAGANVPLSDMAAIYGKIKSKGKAMTEEILQMSDRGIPIIQILADQFGVAKTEIFKMAKEGEISFASIEQGLKSMTTKGGIFDNQMKKQSSTLAGLASTVKDNVNLAFAQLGKEIVKAFDLKTVMSNFIKKIQSVVEWFKNLDDGTKRIIVKITAFTAALGPMTLAIGYLATNVVPGLIKVFGVLRTAMVGLIKVAMANPWVALATGIALVVTAIIAYNSSTEEAVQKTNQLVVVRDKAAKSIAGEQAKLRELLSIAKDENLSKGIRIKAIKDLNKLSPKYLGNLKLETINTDAARIAVEKYTAALISSAKAKAASAALEEVQAKIIEQELNFHHEKEAILTRMQSIGVQTSANDERGAELLLTQNELLKEKELLAKNNIANLNNEASILVDIIKKNQTNAEVIRNTPAPTQSQPIATTLETPAMAGLDMPEIVSPLDGIGEATTAELEQVTAATDGYMQTLENLQALSVAVGNGVMDAFSTMSDGLISSLGLAKTGFDGFIGGLLKTVTKLIAMMLSSAIAQAISGATASGTATGPAAIFTTPVFIATAVSGVMAAFAAIPKFATGGIMGGNSFFGDKLLARINSGEMILNQKQQYNLAGMLQPAMPMVNITESGGFVLAGNDLKLVLDRTINRNNRTQ